MNPHIRARLIQEPWCPKTYDHRELAVLLGIPETTAALIIVSCNGIDPSLGYVQQPWCHHHDLVIYLKDMIEPVVVVESIDELSSHGRWLIGQGWGLDPTRNTYRWIDPEFIYGRYKLTSAVAIESNRSRPIPPSPPDPSIIEGEFVIRVSQD